MFTLTAKCAVATPVAATRKSARAPRARGASSDPGRREGDEGAMDARAMAREEDWTRAWVGERVTMGRDEYRRARWSREGAVARVVGASRARDARGRGRGRDPKT